MMTVEEHKARDARSKKLLLVFAMLSILMLFAGLTSAYVVSKSRRDWQSNYQMPQAFWWSTIIIILCSVGFIFAKRAIKQNNHKQTSLFLGLVFVLSIAFVYSQYLGFETLFKNHLYPVGGAGSISISYLYIIVLAHLAHLAGGLIALLIIIYNHYKQKYNSHNFTGIELGAMYWHFLDALWIYLFLFLYFFK